MTPPILLLLAAVVLSGQPAPELSLSANSAREVDLPRGWPLLVRLVVLHSQRFGYAEVPPLRLAPAGMTWADAIQLPVGMAGSTETAAWDLRLAAPPDDAVLSLPSRRTASVTWRMSPVETAALPIGSYHLSASLEIKDSDGWNGLVQSLPVRIRVLDAAAPLPPEQEMRRQHLEIQYALLDSSTEAAERIVDGLLQSQTNDPVVFATKAQILESRGEIESAYVFAAVALRKAGPTHPAWLLELSGRLHAKLVAP